MFTSSFVLAETHALLLRRLGRQIAAQFLREIERSTTTVEWVSQDDVERAKQVIYQYDDKEFSLTDATSFVIMGRLNITYAFAFDRHFTQYGVTVLTPDHFSRG